MFLGFRERWFKLKYNFLFYHNIDDAGQIETCQPSGVIVLENCNIKNKLINKGCFGFGIVFRNQPHKWHILSGQSESSIERWIKSINEASYEFWRSKLIFLQQVLFNRTGIDPLLMYPRNEGIIKDGSRKYESTFKSHVKSFVHHSSIDIHKSEEAELIKI